MRRTRIAAAIVLVACGLLGLAIASASNPAPASAAGPPAATTGSPSNMAQSSASVSGTVNPNGIDTHYYFQYGTSTAYGGTTASTDAGAGTSPVTGTANITGLKSSTTYHYRVVAVSSAGTTDGADATFTTTTPPAVTAGNPTKIKGTSAGLNGTVNPEGQATTYYYRYGTTTAYGLQTTPSSAGSGKTPVAVHVTIHGLSSTATYHYQLVAERRRNDLRPRPDGQHGLEPGRRDGPRRLRLTGAGDRCRGRMPARCEPLHRTHHDDPQQRDDRTARLFDRARQRWLSEHGAERHRQERHAPEPGVAPVAGHRECHRFKRPEAVLRDSPGPLGVALSRRR